MELIKLSKIILSDNKLSTEAKLVYALVLDRFEKNFVLSRFVFKS